MSTDIAQTTVVYSPGTPITQIVTVTPTIAAVQVGVDIDNLGILDPETPVLVGATGPQGAQGIQGVQGPVGPQGPSGDPNILKPYLASLVVALGS